MSPDLFPSYFVKWSRILHISLCELTYCLPMVYHSSEAALHNRENLFWFDTGLFVLHQLKYLDVFIRLQLKKQNIIWGI